MGKRFTDTGKWDKAWYRKLPPKVKCAWEYLRDRCDLAGVWEIDLDAMEFFVGERVTIEELQQFDVEFLPGGKRLWIRSFIPFQYGNLTEKSGPHRAVIASVKKNSLPVEYSPEYCESPRAVLERLSRAKKLEIMAADFFKCTYCGVPGDDKTLQIDHIIPRTQGGNNDDRNLTTACIPCNSSKGEKDVEEFISRLGKTPGESLKSKIDQITHVTSLIAPFKKLDRVKDKDKDTDKDKEKDQDRDQEKDKERDAKTGIEDLELGDFLAHTPAPAIRAWVRLYGLELVREQLPLSRCGWLASPQRAAKGEVGLWINRWLENAKIRRDKAPPGGPVKRRSWQEIVAEIEANSEQGARCGTGSL